MSKRFSTVLLLSPFLVFCLSLNARAADDDQSAACKTFVQSFYKWYADSAKLPVKNASPLELALKNKRANFSPNLASKLDADIAASAKSPGDVVGLDFDPILNTQENPTKYVVENVRHKGTEYSVDVFSIADGKKSATADVSPELSQTAGNWQFTNFHYKADGKDDDLLKMLKRLADDRKTTSKSKKH